MPDTIPIESSRLRRLVGGCPLPLFTEQSLLKSPLAPLGRKLAGTGPSGTRGGHGEVAHDGLYRGRTQNVTTIAFRAVLKDGTATLSVDLGH